MQPSVLGDIPRTSLLLAAASFRTRQLREGVTLWFEGEPAEELALVMEGSLSARVGGQQVGVVRVGELVGEASVFFGAARTASVVAAEASTVLVLSRDDLAAMRNTLPEVYDPLLHRALEAMARRVRETDLRISTIGEGESAAPSRAPPPSALSRMFRSLSGAGERVPPDVTPVLTTLPVLRDPAAVARIAAAMVPHRVEAGRPVFLQRDAGASAFVLTEGTVEVLREVRGGSARKLAVLARGAVFGTGSLLLAEPRNASCVAASEVWLHELTRTAMAELGGEAGRLWRESLLCALRSQVLMADRHLSQIQTTGGRAARDRLWNAARSVVAYRGEDGDAKDPWSYRGVARP